MLCHVEPSGLVDCITRLHYTLQSLENSVYKSLYLCLPPCGLLLHIHRRHVILYQQDLILDYNINNRIK